MPPLHLSGKETFFGEEEIIVSKTDRRGIITYANDVFCRVAEYSEEELLHQPHSILRHPHMPRCVFKLLWDTIEAGKEIFAFVVNRARSGNHYWVLAHVTPSLDERGNLLGYHSNRRCPDRQAIKKIIPIYELLLKEEARHSNKKSGLDAATQLLVNHLTEQGLTYDEFVWSLMNTEVKAS